MLPKVADFVIIGGGIIGCSIAFNLAKLGGKNIVLLEKEAVLGSSSTAKCSGGIRQQFGSDANIRLSIESVKIFKNWQEQFPYPIEYNPSFLQTGYLFLLHDRKQVREFKRRVALQKKLGIRDVNFVKLPQLQIAIPYLNLDDVIAAVFCASDGVADPSSALYEYARQARMLGVEIFTDAKVFDIGVNGVFSRKVEIVFTNNGPILTNCVINAAGPFAAKIGEMINLEIPILGHRHQTIATPPIKWVSKNDPFVVDCCPGQSFYFRPETGSKETGYQLLLGGHQDDKIEIAEPDNYCEKADQEFILYLAEMALKRFKNSEDIKIMPKSGLAGLYEVTPDVLPILGKTEEIEGVILANGFSGHGFMHSPIVGKIIAEIALNNSSGFNISGLSLDDFKKGTRAPAEKIVV